MKIANLAQFDDIYALFDQSFVPAELRVYDKMKALFKQGAFRFYFEERKDCVIGAMIVWEFSDFIFLENFAIDKNMRGNGWGSRMLKELCMRYPDKRIVLEVETPVDEGTRKRISFYEKAHFTLHPYHYVQPKLRETCNVIDLQLMSNQKDMDPAVFAYEKSIIFQHVYGK